MRDVSESVLLITSNSNQPSVVEHLQSLTIHFGNHDGLSIAADTGIMARTLGTQTVANKKRQWLT